MVTNLKEIINNIKNEFGERAAFRVKTGREEFKEITYNTFVDEINSLGTALISLGLKGKHIAVLSENRYEWIVSYLAVVCGTGVVVPIDRDLTEESITYLLKSGDVCAVLCSKTYEGIIKSMNLSTLDYCISFDRDDKEGNVLSYSKMVVNGKRLMDSGDVSYIESHIDSEKMASILFTSGTTGLSKGVMLSHKNITSNIFGATTYEKYNEHEIMLSVLPYHHSFECTIGLMASLNFGATICINDSLKYFAKNMLLFKPTSMFLVPAIIYAIYKRIQDTEKSMGRSLTPEEVSVGVFGGRLTRIYSGSAPLKPEMIKLFKNYGIKLCQGYGLTETSPVVSTTPYNKLNDDNIKSVGQVIPGCEVKIVKDEIWVRGNNVMLGYYKNPSATDEVFENGWFKTGDLGYFDNGSFLYINGRKKNVIIASGGENVYPEEIEQLLYGVPYITDALIYGGDEDDKDTVTAVIYPNYDMPDTKEEELVTAINKEVQKINEKLPIYKQIITIKIRKTPFEKTTSNKIKRNQNNMKEM